MDNSRRSMIAKLAYSTASNFFLTAVRKIGVIAFSLYVAIKAVSAKNVYAIESETIVLLANLAPNFFVGVFRIKQAKFSHPPSHITGE